MTWAQASPRVLIAYYSRSGRTERIASGLARASHADCEALATTASRRGLLGGLWTGLEAICERESRILPPKCAPHEYDIVLLGTPVWGPCLSSPVRTYLDRYAETLPEVAFFVISAGGGAERALQQMEYLAGKQPLATLALTAHDLQRHTAVYLGEFWEHVLCAWESRARCLPGSG